MQYLWENWLWFVVFVPPVNEKQKQKGWPEVREKILSTLYYFGDLSSGNRCLKQRGKNSVTSRVWWRCVCGCVLLLTWGCRVLSQEVCCWQSWWRCRLLPWWGRWTISGSVAPDARSSQGPANPFRQNRPVIYLMKTHQLCLPYYWNVYITWNIRSCISTLKI